MGDGLVLIQEDETVGPAIFDRQFGQSGQDAGIGFHGETVDGYGLDIFTADHRYHAAI